MSNAAEFRIRDNRHFAQMLRKRLESRHGSGALRETLAQLSDSELVDLWLRNEEQGREHSKNMRAKKGARE
jgi:hypothetical protein